MGEDQGNVRALDELRDDIARTRADLGETAAALGATADVKGRAKQRLHEVRDNVAATTPDGAAAAVKHNPVPTAAIAAFATGVLVGWLIAR